MKNLLCILVMIQASTALAIKSPENAVVSDWMALGSGCRGKDPDVGDLRMKVFQDPKDPMRLEVKFDMGSYTLSGEKPLNPEHQSFARECSLRFALAPQGSFRVRTVEAQTSFLVDKDKGVKAEIHSRLVTPKGTLADWEKVFASGKGFKNERVSMALSANEEGKRILKEAACGEPKILGADFTFENDRKSFKEKVELKHDKANTVGFVVYLEPCSKS